MGEIDATVRLAQLLPTRTDLDTLRTVLDARADVNALINDQPSSSSLRRFTNRAPTSIVREVRAMLFQYGATENEEDMKVWNSRQ